MLDGLCVTDTILSHQLLKTALLKPQSFPLRADEICVIQQLILLPQHFLTSTLYILATTNRLFQNSALLNTGKF